MMWCKTSVLALAIAQLSLSTALPLDYTNNNKASEAIVMGEATVSSNNLHISSVKMKVPEHEEENTHYNHNAEKQQNDKSETPEPTNYESDYFFLPDKFPDLPNDEYLDIDDDATPFDFLKQNNISEEDNVSTQPLTPANNATNAIYITVPIFINTGNAGAPLSLSVGGQTIPLNSNTSPSKAKSSKNLIPTSYFNKLAYRSFSTQKRHHSSFQGRSLERNHRKPIRNTPKYSTYLVYF